MLQGKSFTLSGKISCEKYETVRSKILEARENSGISFSLIGGLEVVDQALEFFLGLGRKSADILFEDIYTFLTNLTVSTRRNLRTLEESTISDIPMTCKLNESLVLDLIGGYDCVSDTNDIKGTPLSMKMATDSILDISGIDNINLQSASSNGIDYSNLDLLKKINTLPLVDVEQINGDSCIEIGQYIIYGKISDTSEVEEYYSDVEIILKMAFEIFKIKVNFQVFESIVIQFSFKGRFFLCFYYRFIQYNWLKFFLTYSATVKFVFCFRTKKYLKKQEQNYLRIHLLNY